MKKLLSIAIILCTVVALAGCGEKKPDFAAADYRLANSAIAEDLDLHRTSMSSDFNILGNIMEGLYTLGENDAPEKALATGYTVNEDPITDDDGNVLHAAGTIYTFTIRQGAKWSNGDEITAQDFVYSWQRAVNTSLAFVPEYASMFDIIENGRALRQNSSKDYDTLGVEAVDNYTLKVTLTKPVPWFLQLTAFPAFFPAHQATIEKYGEDYGSTAKALIFNGPFKVTYWDTDYGIYLEKNEDYWDADAVKIDSISYLKVENSATRLLMFDQGKLDRVGLTGSEYEDREDQATVREEVVTWYIQFNLDDPNFQNEDLRKAIFYGIDKTELVQVLKPYVPTDAFVPHKFSSTPDGVDFRDFKTDNVDSTKWNYDFENNGMYDKTLAQTHLDAALATLGVDELTVNFSCFDSEGWQPLFENILSQLGELDGLTVALDKAPGGETYEKYEEGTFEFGFAGWGPDYPNPLTYLEMWESSNSHNYPNYNDEDYDLLIHAASTNIDVLADVDAQYEKLALCEDQMLEDAIIVPLANRAGGILENDKISGVILHNFGSDATWKYVERSE